MAQFGSNGGMLAQNLSQILDDQGNPIIASSTGFGDSPAGQALLTQQLFGLANATFNLTPPSVGDIISFQNPVPYWDFQDYSNNVMAGSAVYDATAQTWGILINPGTAVSGDYCTFTTRSYLINDDNLGLRQKALAVIAKTGSAAGTTQWNLTLNSIYYDASGSALGTAAIGTALDTGTWTSLSGYTTTGGTAINAAARYVDIQFKLTATATITGSAAVTIKSCLLSSKIGANSSFLVTETFTSSTTWTVPSGVTTLYAVAAVGSGGGGGGGAIGAVGSDAARVSGACGGGGAPYVLVKDIAIGTATSFSVGVGAGGTGGTAQVASKAAAATTTYALNGAVGAAGGATTFGSLISITGGGGGSGGSANITTTLSNPGTGGTAGVGTSTTFGAAFGTAASAGATLGNYGGKGGTATVTASSSSQGDVGGRGLPLLNYPYVGVAVGTNGTALTSSGTAVTVTSAIPGTASPNATIGGGGGGAGAAAGSATVTQGGDPSAAISAGGGFGGAAAVSITGAGAGTIVVTAGAGGSALNTYGGGGGAGGHISLGGSGTNYNARALTLTSGAGGNGGSGLVVVVYVA